MNRLLHRLLYWLLPLPLYLRVVSGALFWSLRFGVGRYSRATEYIFHLSKLISRGGVAIDIGANLGYYTRPLSRIVGSEGRVYAVEPVPLIFSVLRRNVSGCDNVELLNVALGAEEQHIKMSNSSVGECGYFGTGQTGVGEGRGDGAIEFEAMMCRGSRLFDSLERIDLIKCDIEGYEGVVIPEMMQIIERHHPVVLLESGGETRGVLIELLQGVGYECFELDRGVEIPLREGSDKDIIFRVKGGVKCE